MQRQGVEGMEAEHCEHSGGVSRVWRQGTVLLRQGMKDRDAGCGG